MRSVWKFLLDETGNPQPLHMPEEAEILTVHQQAGRVALWAEVDANKPRVPRWFIITPTGGQVPENGEYVGTVFLDNNRIVFHLWELEGQE
jgi:hypothetical protein